MSLMGQFLVVAVCGSPDPPKHRSIQENAAGSRVAICGASPQLLEAYLTWFMLHCNINYLHCTKMPANGRLTALLRRRSVPGGLQEAEVLLVSGRPNSRAWSASTRICSETKSACSLAISSAEPRCARQIPSPRVAARERWNGRGLAFNRRDGPLGGRHPVIECLSGLFDASLGELQDIRQDRVPWGIVHGGPLRLHPPSRLPRPTSEGMGRWLLRLRLGSAWGLARPTRRGPWKSPAL